MSDLLRLLISPIVCFLIEHSSWIVGCDAHFSEERNAAKEEKHLSVCLDATDVSFAKVMSWGFYGPRQRVSWWAPPTVRRSASAHWRYSISAFAILHSQNKVSFHTIIEQCPASAFPRLLSALIREARFPPKKRLHSRPKKDYIFGHLSRKSAFRYPSPGGVPKGGYLTQLVPKGGYLTQFEKGS